MQLHDRNVSLTKNGISSLHFQKTKLEGDACDFFSSLRTHMQVHRIMRVEFSWSWVQFGRRRRTLVFGG